MPAKGPHDVIQKGGPSDGGFDKRIACSHLWSSMLETLPQLSNGVTASLFFVEHEGYAKVGQRNQQTCISLKDDAK